MNFNLLCTELGINQQHTMAEKLALLKIWVHKTLSQDVRFRGSEQEQYVQYQKIITTYFEHILPALTTDVMQAYPKFDHENLLTTLGYLGFDRVLVNLKPDATLLNTPSASGATALHMSTLKGHVHTTKALLALGADPAVLNKQKQSALSTALFVPMLHDNQLIQHKMTIFKFLKEHDHFALNHKDRSGNTVLHLMAQHDGFSSLMEQLLNTNPELAYIHNNHSHYPIHTAILNAQLKNVKLLLTLKDGASLADANGWVALHYAARHANTNILELCYAASPNINIEDRQGKTPLELATELQRAPAEEFLLAHGAQNTYAP